MSNRTCIDHPSSIIVGFYRQSHGPRGVALFGSDLVHHETVCLRVQEATMDASSIPPRYHGHGRTLIELVMSEIQFAELLTTFNRGEGVPATLKFVTGKGDIPQPELPKTFDHVQADFQEAIQEVEDRLDVLTETVTGSKIAAGLKKNLLMEIAAIRTRHRSTIPFIVEQFTRHIRKVATSAKAEVEAYINNRMLGVSGRGKEELEAPVRLEIPESTGGES